MRSSMSRSTYWLIAFAPPAARYPPIMVQRNSQPFGTPPAATNIAPAVVSSSSEMIRGLVSRT